MIKTYYLQIGGHKVGVFTFINLVKRHGKLSIRIRGWKIVVAGGYRK
jgi:hypothetical protein